ncbi:MAG: hypothetical protein AAGA30_14160, partial [Planctomycetota bacterium]
PVDFQASWGEAASVPMPYCLSIIGGRQYQVGQLTAPLEHGPYQSVHVDEKLWIVACSPIQRSVK